ncbi:MAG: hypothetical protein KatS3mg002_1005 [Candidatus Woesearchaeota archaeon]|nr:MAG: hypothetical protein KatS3mg002_1005 [Candidatus Woesearchaeota archaeon]
MKTKNTTKKELIYRLMITLSISIFGFIFGGLFFETFLGRVILGFLSFANLFLFILLFIDYINSNENK